MRGAGVVVDVGRGVTSVEERRSRHSAIYAGMPAVPVLPVAENQFVHRDPRDAGPGSDARRHIALSRLAANPSITYMGTSTFANCTVLPEIAVAKIRDDAPFDKVCYIGCGVTTGIAPSSTLQRSSKRQGRSCSALAASGSTCCRASSSPAPNDHRVDIKQ